MNDQHEDIEPEENRFTVTDDGKLQENEERSADFEEDLTF